MAILTILEELGVIERYVASGGKIEPQDLQDLGQCLGTLAAIMTKVDRSGATDWHSDHEPLPSWLQPRRDDEDVEKQTANKV